MIKMFSEGYDKDYKGLENTMGANNWFLNVVIQSLWHIASFRKNFKCLDAHKHKKGKKRGRQSKMESGLNERPSTVPTVPTAGYPSMRNSGSSAYPSIEPMGGYPSIENNGLGVPTKGKKLAEGAGYPMLHGSGGLGDLPPPIYTPEEFPKQRYTSPSSISYPSLDGSSGT